MAQMLTQEALKRLMSYNPETGVFTWLVDRSDKIKAGDVAGGKNSIRGYKRIGIDYKVYPAHRLAFLYMTGKWPQHFVDHIDGNRSNNAWNNLRQATPAQNAANKCMQKNNSSGHIGVWKPKGRNRWVVQVCGKHVASCATLEEANVAYSKAASAQFGEFYRNAETV
jgi:hypothetical protein